MNAFIVEHVHLTQQEIDEVRTVLNMPGYTTLRQMIAARACESMLTKLDAGLYDTEAAKLKVQQSEEAARRFNAAVDVLDELAAPGAEWFRIKLDQRR